MTSAMTTAAVYETWLGIPAAQHPPHHYALLGLSPLAANEQAILQAYQQRAMLVGQQLGGPQADAARRLLGELAAAQACLLNADARAAYDHWLAPRLRSSPPGSGVLAGAAGVAAGAGSSRPAPRSKHEPPVSASPKADEAAAPPYSPYVEPEEPSSALPWLVGGVCAGLLAVAVLGVALFGMKRSSPTNIAQNPTNSTAQDHGKGQSQADDKEAARQKRTKKRDRNTELTITLEDDDVLGQRIAPLTTKPEAVRLDGSIVGPPDGSDASEVVLSIDPRDETPLKTIPRDDEPKPAVDAPPDETTKPEPAPASALAKLPRAFALPSRTSGGAQGVLAQLPVKDAEAVKLKLETAGVAGGSQFKLLNATAGFSPGERIWPVQHTVASGAPRTVGEYALTDGELSFRWADSALASDEVLANAALAVSIDGELVEINQRSPDAVAPLRLAVDVGAISTSAKIDAPPPSAKLFFAVDNQGESFPAHQLSPDEPAPAGEEIDVIFGEATDPFRLAMRVSLVDNGAGGVRIEARPMMQAAGDGQKWELFRPKSVLQTLALMKQQESLLDGQLDQLQQRYRRNSPQLQQATDLFNRQATELQTRILTLEKMHALCEELNDHGALNYRVFAKLGDRDVDLVDSSLGITLPVADLVKPADDKDDASAIVGPPTAPPDGAAPAPKDPAVDGADEE